MSPFTKKLAVIFIIGLILRIGYVLFIPQIDVQRGDSAVYNTIARNLVYEGSFSVDGIEPDAYWAPGYPFFLSFIYKSFGFKFTAVRMVQALLSALVIIFVYCIADAIFSRRAAGISCVVTCLYPGFIGYCGIFAPQLMVMFLISLFIFLLVKFRMNLYLALAMGVIAGYSALSRAELLLFWPLLFLLMVFGVKQKKPAVGFIALMFITMCLIVSLWSIRNYKIFGKVIPVSVKFGDTLWISTWKEEWLEWYDREPNSSISRGRNRVEASSAYFRAGLDNIKEHPFIYIKMCFKRAYRLWLTGNSNIFYFMRDSFMAYWRGKQFAIFFIKLIMLVFNVIVIAAGFFGMKAALTKSGRGKIPVYYIFSPILFLMVLHFFTFATPRYIIPVMPLVVIFASYGFIEYKRENREKS